MYSGIVFGTEKIQKIEENIGYSTIYVTDTQSFFTDAFIGASVAIDGVCLTVKELLTDQGMVSFDISDLTKEVTTLKDLQIGQVVNVERSLKVGMENGGHSMYGHIESTALVQNCTFKGETLHLTLKLPSETIKYFFLKGFIGLHGCSLTVNHVDKARAELSVYLIPETLRLTNFKDVQPGQALNFEIDQTTRTLVDTLTHIYAQQADLKSL
ncbi:riboflavin synthase [Acinetobacter apis]|uniref:Riboflavin synthase n=1 Tax=Acinetobacter apis TaxID=1229165 RepID=A0A217EF97_9GAMM|nr:riboflavin synthase subunit alpha [Acinetobacter apis]SNQ29178.1 riboflavin synthase alpha chain [Acinetobacter apis]